jgi:hypothetical protein
LDLVKNVARRALLVLFVPLLLAGSGPAGVLYACAAMGSVQAACCCPEHADEPSPARVSRACCCERITLAGTLPGASLPSEWSAPLAVALWRWHEPAKLSRPEPLAHAAATRAARLRTAEPRAGPSAVILHRRLLI